MQQAPPENVTQHKNIAVLIDDDAAIRESVKQILELEGYTVATASNGREGLDALRNLQNPCLILLDLMMPEMNGWEFIEAVSQDVSLSLIPIVILTAYAERAKNIQAQGLIKKPIELDTLLEFVKRYCN